jgi:hypothetical protein
MLDMIVAGTLMNLPGAMLKQLLFTWLAAGIKITRLERGKHRMGARKLFEELDDPLT